MSAGLQGSGYDPAALMLDKLDQIIDLMRIQIGLPPTTHFIKEREQIRTPLELQLEQNLMMELMLAGTLPSAPATTEAFNVTNREMPIAANESIPLMRVDVTNDNVAQSIWVSCKRGVLVTTGRRILAQTTVPFVLPAGSQLYAICAIPVVSTRVSVGYDFYSMLNALRERRRQ